MNAFKQKKYVSKAHSFCSASMVPMIILCFSFISLFPYAVFFRWRKKKLSRFIWLLNLLWLICWNSPNEWIRWSDKMKWLCIYETVWPEFLMKISVREEVKRFVMLLQFFNEHNRVTILNWGTIFIFPFFACCDTYISLNKLHKCLISAREEVLMKISCLFLENL
jgi:hypothetical protein